MSKSKKEKAQSQLDKYVALQNEIKEFKASLEGKAKEELNKIEQDLIKESDEVNEKVQASELKLSADGYAEACKAIKALISKTTVAWQQVQMMLDIYDAWNEATEPTKVTYKNLDATLRQLGQLQFSGVEEWQACDTVNKYMEASGLKDAYLEATEQLYFYAEKHNAVMQAQEALDGAANLVSPEAANRK